MFNYEVPSTDWLLKQPLGGGDRDSGCFTTVNNHNYFGSTFLFFFLFYFILFYLILNLDGLGHLGLMDEPLEAG